MLIAVENDGPLITATNYFTTEFAERGLIYCSINERAFRLLVPPTSHIESDNAEYVIVSRGIWPKKGREFLELLWEDHTEAPYSLAFETHMIDRIPLAEDAGRTDLRCIGYAPDLSVLFDLPARYRTAPRIPFLQPWKKKN